MAYDPLNCICNGWCDCHRSGKACDGSDPHGVCRCRERTDAEKEEERSESERMARFFIQNIEEED